MASNRKYLLFLLIFALLLGGCTLPWQKKAQPEALPDTAQASEEVTMGNSGQLKKFSSYQELKSFLETNSPQLDRDYAREVMTTGMAAEGIEASDYSKTNIQVEGVDEGDIIKTDGDYIYALVYNDLFIIKARPANETKAVSKISFKSRPSEIYIDSGKLVVIGADDQIMTSAAYRNFRRHSPYTFVKIFDLVDPASPKQLRDLDFEGSYQSSRIVDGRLYLIIDNFDSYVANEMVTPRLVDNGKVLSNDCSANSRCFAPDVYYFDIPYDSYNFTSINSLDLKTADAPVAAQTYLLGGTQLLYASAKNLYLSYIQYLDRNDLLLAVMEERLSARLPESEKQRLAKIKAADSDVLSVSEKKQKRLQLFENYLRGRAAEEMTALEGELESALAQKYEAEADNLERTVIHKFALGGDQPVYRANGSVPGTALNQFSFDEDANGDLRVATTRSANLQLDGNESYTGLSVLDTNLKPVGAISKIAPGERIYSVRFIGKRAYLVTFKQTDPLFAIDLSNRQAPRILGELKVPGFSNYLHPYDENTLIGLGKDAQVDAYGNVKTGGIKLSLFDVTDPAAPKELDSYVSGSAGSDSLALSDHKAFLFSRDKNLLAFPASLVSSASGYRPYFSGALVFSVIDQKFVLKGQIDHSDGGKYQRQDTWCGWNCYDASVRRAIYIQESLYTFSNKYLWVNSLSDLSPVAAVRLIPDTEADAKAESMSPPSVPAEIETSTAPVGPAGPVMPAQETPPAETFIEMPAADNASSTDTVNP